MKPVAVVHALLPLLLVLVDHSTSLQVYMKAASDTTKCVTSNPNNLDSQPLNMATCAALATQKWAQNSGAYGPVQIIRSGNTVGGGSCSTQCLDVPVGTGDGAPVVQTNCNIGTRTQWWTLPTSGTGFNAINFVTAGCLTAESGTLVDNYHCITNALYQRWNIGTADSTLGGSTFTSQSVLFLLNSMGVKGGSGLSGAAIEMPVISTGALYQHFTVDTLLPSKFAVQSGNLCLDGGGSASNAYQYTCVPTALNHQWISTTFPEEIVPNGGTYLVDMLSGLCLTWNTSDLKVRTDSCVRGNVQQQWNLVFV